MKNGNNANVQIKKGQKITIIILIILLILIVSLGIFLFMKTQDKKDKSQDKKNKYTVSKEKDKKKNKEKKEKDVEKEDKLKKSEKDIEKEKKEKYRKSVENAYLQYKKLVKNEKECKFISLGKNFPPILTVGDPPYPSFYYMDGNVAKKITECEINIYSNIGAIATESSNRSALIHLNIYKLSNGKLKKVFEGLMGDVRVEEDLNQKSDNNSEMMEEDNYYIVTNSKKVKVSEKEFKRRHDAFLKGGKKDTINYELIVNTNVDMAYKNFIKKYRY